jgi:hypothetical protein
VTSDWTTRRGHAAGDRARDLGMSSVGGSGLAGRAGGATHAASESKAITGTLMPW